jgi:ADP-ribose pyrophosphatase
VDRVTASRVAYENPWMVLREDRLERADGSPGLYAYVVKPRAAIVVAVGDGPGTPVWLVEQHRHPLGERCWELPQGAADEAPGTGPQDVARAELAEETGLRAGRLEHVGALAFMPGLSAQRFDVWLARDLEAGTPRPSAEEADLRAAPFPAAEVERLVLAGTIVDSATVAAWGLVRLRGLVTP